MASMPFSTANKPRPTFTSPSTSQTFVTIITTGPPSPPDAGGSSEKPQEHKFIIHKDFICYYSPFFSAAFNGSFQESATQTMKLEEVDAYLFGILVDWIYTQVVAGHSKRLDLEKYAKLWILADQFLMRKMQNNVMMHIHLNLEHIIADDRVFGDFGEFMRVASELKHEDNPLARIAARTLVCCPREFFDRFVGEAPNQILLAVTRGLKQGHDFALSTGLINVGWEDVQKFFVDEKEMMKENELAEC